LKIGSRLSWKRKAATSSDYGGRRHLTDCRLFQDKTSPWLLKGGYAMELRIRVARTTPDIHLALRHATTSSNEWNDRTVTAR